MRGQPAAQGRLARASSCTSKKFRTDTGIREQVSGPPGWSAVADFAGRWPCGLWLGSACGVHRSATLRGGATFVSGGSRVRLRPLAAKATSTDCGRTS
jgi:hypothetical protein